MWINLVYHNMAKADGRDVALAAMNQLRAQDVNPELKAARNKALVLRRDRPFRPPCRRQQQGEDYEVGRKKKE